MTPNCNTPVLDLLHNGLDQAHSSPLLPQGRTGQAREGGQARKAQGEEVRILFLDDAQKRHEAFDRLSKGHQVDHVYTVHEAITALETNPRYDLASLDHDLDGRHMVASEDPSTGYWVAKHIAGMSKRPNSVQIHTWNGAGAHRMLYELSPVMGSDVEYHPFGSWMPPEAA